jgi:hypothetical protein
VNVPFIILCYFVAMTLENPRFFLSAMLGLGIKFI